MVSRNNDVVIVGAARTPFGKLMGALAKISATDLGSKAIAGALATAGVDGQQVGAVILGQVLQAGVGQNPAKQAALGAGIRQQAHTLTINKVCLSGLTAVIDAARLLRCGEADLVVAGGMESMTLAPHLLPKSRAGYRFGDVTVIDHMAFDALSSAGDGQSMGALTESYADRYPWSREAQDRWAAKSHQRAAKAWQQGLFTSEIVAMDELLIDEGIRENATAESLARLRPAFGKNGTITAGNASQITDGGAALVLARRDYAEANGIKTLAVVRSCGQVAGPDHSLQAKPARALEQALQREGWGIGDLDVAEINEAFAAVTLQSAKELGLPEDVVNPDGGAIAIGHPVGASGARLAVHAAWMLAQGRASRAGVALCGGGGQGEALLLSAD